MLSNVTVRLAGLVRGALKMMRVTRFCIRRTLSNSILSDDVYTELAYIMNGFMNALK